MCGPTKDTPKIVVAMPANSWSDWLDFDQDTIDQAPESEGVFMMHKAMKILFIGGSTNIKTSLAEKKSDSCTSGATRFKFMEACPFPKILDGLISDYQGRHGGNLPECMQHVR